MYPVTYMGWAARLVWPPPRLPGAPPKQRTPVVLSKPLRLRPRWGSLQVPSRCPTAQSGCQAQAAQPAEWDPGKWAEETKDRRKRVGLGQSLLTGAGRVVERLKQKLPSPFQQLTGARPRPKRRPDLKGNAGSGEGGRRIRQKSRGPRPMALNAPHGRTRKGARSRSPYPSLVAALLPSPPQYERTASPCPPRARRGRRQQRAS